MVAKPARKLSCPAKLARVVLGNCGPLTPTEVAEASEANRQVSLPYTKVMNSNNAVEQSAAVIICSVEVAERGQPAPEERVAEAGVGVGGSRGREVGHGRGDVRRAGGRDRTARPARAVPGGVTSTPASG